jgi:biotin carboxylase
MNKRLMILGAGRGQIGLIKTAKSMGITTVVATGSGSYPGITLADEVCYVDISNPEAVYEKAKVLNLDGIATCCLDTGIRALGYTCDRLGLFGLSEKAAIMSNDKLLMKEALVKNGVNTAKFVKVNSQDSFADALKQLNMPVIIKAVDLQGSRGIYIARTEKEAYNGYRATMSETRKEFCIIEEFIEGYEFGAQAFVYNNEVLFVLPHGDNIYISNTAVPIGHYAPFEGSEDIHKQAEKAVVSAIRAMGLNNCAVNVDLIVRDNKVYIIELTGRVGANCLPELVSIYYGINYYEMIAATALGKDPRPIFYTQVENKVANASRMLFSESQSGILKEIVNNNQLNDIIYEITFFIEPGSEIRKFTNSNDCIGQVIVKGETLEACQNYINKVLENIHFVIK